MLVDFGDPKKGPDPQFENRWPTVLPKICSLERWGGGGGGYRSESFRG
jgi:hypothetical protein